MSDTQLTDLAKVVPDGRVSKKGNLICPRCNSNRLDVCLGGAGQYECAECGQLLNDPNRPKSADG